MRKIIFILLLIVVHNKQLFSADLESTKDWDFSYELTKEIKTEKSHNEIRIMFHLSTSKNEAFTYFISENYLKGSIESNKEEILFYDNALEITREKADEFKLKLEHAGINELLDLSQTSSKKSDLFWQEDLTFNSKRISFESPPEKGTRLDVNDAIFSFIDEMGLGKLDDPKKIVIFVIGETSSFLSLELSEPLKDLDYYGKIIKSMEIYEEQRIKKALITIVDSNDQVFDTWNATIPDPNKYFASYKGREVYEGKTIDSIYPITEVVVSEGDYEPSRKVSLQEILENPDKFHGKRVCVKGFYDFQFEGMDFHDKQGNNVWIGDWSSFAKRNNEIILAPNLVEGRIFGRHRGYATVEGIFIKGPGGHGGLWPGEITRITKLDSHFKPVEYILRLILLCIIIGIVLLIRKIRRRFHQNDKAIPTG